MIRPTCGSMQSLPRVGIMQYKKLACVGTFIGSDKEVLFTKIYRNAVNAGNVYIPNPCLNHDTLRRQKCFNNVRNNLRLKCFVELKLFFH